MINFTVGRNQQVSVWINEPSPGSYAPESWFEIEKPAAAGEPKASHYQVYVETSLTPGRPLFAALGGWFDLEDHPGALIRIGMLGHSAHAQPYARPHAGPTAHVGVPAAYLAGLQAGTRWATEDDVALARGTYTFSAGAHSDYGSSPVLVGVLARGVLELMARQCDPIDAEHSLRGAFRTLARRMYEPWHSQRSATM